MTATTPKAVYAQLYNLYVGAIRRHLVPGRLLVHHLDLPGEVWLTGKPAQKEVAYPRGELLTHPISG